MEPPDAPEMPKISLERRIRLLPQLVQLSDEELHLLLLCIRQLVHFPQRGDSPELLVHFLGLLCHCRCLGRPRGLAEMRPAPGVQIFFAERVEIEPVGALCVRRLRLLFARAFEVGKCLLALKVLRLKFLYFLQ